jgi:hypothetical protein
VLRSLDESVQDYARAKRVSLEAAVATFRQAIDANSALHPGLRDKLTAALDAVAQGTKLHAKLARRPEFNGLKQQDVWRLFAGGQVTSKWDLEHHGQGSLAGMQRAFETMLDGLDHGEPLSAKHLESIHQAGCKDTFQSDTLQLSFKSEIDLETQGEIRDLARLPAQYRGGDTNLNTRKDRETTPDGRRELLQAAGTDDWFKRVDVRDEAVETRFAPRSPEQCRSTYRRHPEPRNPHRHTR